MARAEISIQIEKRFSATAEESWLKRAVAKTLSREGPDSPTELSLVVTDDETVRQLNMKYRGANETTDVLAFAAVEGTPFVMPPDGVAHLGEVIISYPQAERQAKEHGHAVKHELALLSIHGVLHLLGCEHDEPQREREMRARETELLKEIESV
jgi:probable rRNA maturation factor